MQSSTFILATILGTLTLSQAQGGFYSSCDPTTFNYQKNYTGVLGFAVTIHGWLSGECQGSDGTYTNSTLDLSVCLTNNNGNLTWQANGAFVNTCSCNISGLPQLCCTCETSTNSKISGVCVDLNDEVAFVNDTLSCPDVPSR